MDGNTRFCSRNTFFFLFPLYIGLFQHSLFVIFLFHYRTGKYVLIVRFYITPTRLLYRPFVKSMLHYVKSHIYKNYIFFTASINLFYSSSFLQSIDRWQFLLYKKYVYILSSSFSFEHNMPGIPYLTNEHQEKLTAGMYEMSNVLKMYRISRCGQPNEGG